MKKFLSIILSLAMVFSLSAAAFAAEGETAPPTTTEISDNSYGNVTGSATFKVLPLDRKTFWGNAGSCTLDYLSQGYVNWSILVDGVILVAFEGNLHFNKLGTPFETFDHSITTASTSGTEDVKYGLSKGDWEVTFTGLASDAEGNSYAVVDDATLPFNVYQNR